MRKNVHRASEYGFGGNVFHKFTRQSLKANRTRTLVTVVGIILSMALFTVVMEGIYSGLQFLISVAVESSGNWQGSSVGVTSSQLHDLSKEDEVDRVAYWQQIGWAEIGSENEYKPYLLIVSISDHFSDLVSVRLESGRMPEHENEIILPTHLQSNGGVSYQIGDTLTLDVGKRMAEGVECSAQMPYDTQVPEYIAEGTAKTYTVVGMYQETQGVCHTAIHRSV
ncbi:MAG: ABC transporter permease [Lachnospiraceae bacterium]|nr:ABC transporter permease [Lachnospiraceae bacterium]